MILVHFALLCFPVLGAFGTPIQKTVSLSVEDVIFQLYTENNRVEGTRITIGDTPLLLTTEFKPAIPTKIIVHGWTDNITADSIAPIKDEFLQLEPMNVFGVDWSACSKVIMYDQSVACTKQLGGYLADLITWLKESTGLDPLNVHAMGHSLGAEAISFISTKHKISRMTGFDPASPLFQYVDAKGRIDETDAHFVDIIHTSLNILGMKKPVGHVDYYVNGGHYQPGCPQGFLGFCSHEASHKYFQATISQENRTRYQGTECDTFEDAQNQTCTGTSGYIMGYGADPTYRGIYLVHTDEVP